MFTNFENMPVKPDKRIRFFFLEQNISLRDRNTLKRYLVRLIANEGRTLNWVNYIFCSDDYLLEVNRKFLQHDFYTDILTFDLSEKGAPIEAEIYISIDRVRDNALNLSIPVRNELHRVMFHGVLHLCGYGDKSKKEIAVIREMEDYYIKRMPKKVPREK